MKIRGMRAMTGYESLTVKKDISVDFSGTAKEKKSEGAKNQPSEYSEKPVYEFVKRIFDFVASLAALIVLSPLLLALALVIYFDDKGNPIFSQYRCGRNGKQFKMYKFRTMCTNAEELLCKIKDQNEMDGPVFKIKDDPRITKVGKVLRSSGLDELPQLVNILMGNMSVVGPRPALPKEVEQYSEEDKVRLSVMPGLTCYWQIAPDRNSVSFEQWMKLDRQYIKDRNVLVDIVIILKTVVTVIKRQGC